MVPSKSDRRWKELIKGDINYDFSNLSAGMNLSRNKRVYAKTPDDATLQKCVEDMHDFFVKFESTFENDISAIFK